jgi:hypothetical protein
MFERKRLSAKTAATVERLAASCQSEIPDDERPYLYGLRGAPLAASFVGVGLDLLSSLISEPPADDQGRETKRLVAALEPGVGMQASTFLTHALIAFDLKWHEYSARPPLSAGDHEVDGPFIDLERQLPAGLSHHYPIAEEDRKLIEENLRPFRYFDARPGDVQDEELGAFEASGYMSYLASEDLQKSASPDQVREFVQSHVVYVHRRFQVPISRRALELVLGVEFAESAVPTLGPLAGPTFSLSLGLSWRDALDEFARMLGRVVAREFMG